MYRSALFLMLAAAVAAPAIGCSASEVETPVIEAASAVESTSSVLGKVAAIKINGRPAIAAPAKVRRVLENLGLQPGAPTPADGAQPRCIPSYSIELLDAAGNTAATLGFFCGAAGSETRLRAEGHLRVGSKSYRVYSASIDALDAIASEPRAMGDYVFGTTTVKIVTPVAGAPELVTEDAALVKKASSAVRADEVPDATAPSSRCVPNRVVVFLDGSTELGSLGLTCGDDARGQVTGRFTSGAVRGAVQVDATAISEVALAIPRPASSP